MKLTKKRGLHEVLNEERVECRYYYDKINESVELCDDITDIEDRLENEEVILFPTRDELYPYGKAMRDYLDTCGIHVPSGKKPIGHLVELGCKYDFYERRDEEAKKRLLTWLEERKIPIEII